MSTLRRYSKRGQTYNEIVRDKNIKKLLDFFEDEYDFNNFLDTDKIDLIIRDIKINNILDDDDVSDEKIKAIIRELEIDKIINE